MKNLRYNDFQRRKELPVWIGGFAIRDEMSGIVKRKSGMEDYFFALFYTPVCIVLNGTETSLPGGTIKLWCPGEPQIFGEQRGTYHISWLRFNGARAEEILKSCRISSGDVFNMGHYEVLERYLEKLYQELCQEPYQDKRIIEGVADLMFREVSREIYCHAALDVPERMRNIKMMLDNTPPVKFTVGALAKTAGMSPSGLNGEFKRYFGYSPMEYWNKNRMEYAKLLLRDETLNITQIAANTGFQDVFQFSRAFKKHFNVSPSIARKMRF